jgi:hypothetical protein
MGTFPFPGGIGMIIKTVFINRLKDVYDGMMNHPVSERGHGNRPLFGIIYLKCMETFRMIGTGYQLLLQVQHFFFCMKVELFCGVCHMAAFIGFTPG